MGEPLNPVNEIAAFEARRSLYLAAGFAPGSYWCTCDFCQKRFDGDKRAWRCFDCATGAINERHALE
jgi:hypothetical protein